MGLARPGTWKVPPDQVRPREVEIPQFVADGLRADEIAARLYLARETVKDHTKHARERLGVHTAAAAVAIAMRRGLIS